MLRYFPSQKLECRQGDLKDNRVPEARKEDTAKQRVSTCTSPLVRHLGTNKDASGFAADQIVRGEFWMLPVVIPYPMGNPVLYASGGNNKRREKR